MNPKTLGAIQLILALLAILLVFYPMNMPAYLPTLLLALTFVITAVHHFTEKGQH
jgi:hypothetical protein